MVDWSFVHGITNQKEIYLERERDIISHIPGQRFLFAMKNEPRPRLSQKKMIV